MDLVRVLEVLDHEEPARTRDGGGEAADQQLRLAELRGAHGPGGREARRDQHAGVDRAHLRVEVRVRVRVDLRVVRPVEDVRDEQRREEQHLLPQEDPDAQLAAVELVLRVVVVVLDELGPVPVSVPMIVSVGAVRLLTHRSPFLSPSSAGAGGSTAVAVATGASDTCAGVAVVAGAGAGSVAIGARRSQTSSSTSTRSS